MKPAQSGSYRVIVWNKGCASDTSVAFNFNVNGIIPNNSSGKLKLFPNPSTGKLTLQLSQPGLRNVSVILTDALGRQVYAREMKAGMQGEIKEELDLAALANGIYLLQINGAEKRYYQKLVIEK